LEKLGIDGGIMYKSLIKTILCCGEDSSDLEWEKVVEFSKNGSTASGS